MTTIETPGTGAPATDELGNRSNDWLEAEITSLAGHIAAATCRWVLLVAEYDRREGHHRWESHSCAHWLTWKCGMSIRTAREHVRVGRALEHLTVTTAAFAAGRLSYSKVRAITRVATPTTERDLVAVAEHGTATHVDRIVAGHRTVTRNADPDRARRQLRRRGIWVRTEDDGAVTLTVRGTPDSIATILRAVDEAAKAGPELVDEPESPGAAKRVDALEHVASTFLDPDGPAGPSRTELVVHADLETLTMHEAGRAEIEGGASITTSTLDRLACDCGVRLTTEANGDTLDVGRRARTPPTALARAIRDRDRSRCRFPSCTHLGRLQIHHRVHWTHGGPTSKDNCFLVCRYHHRVLHEGGWHAEGRADGSLVFVDPDGRRVPEVAASPAASDPHQIRHQHDGLGVVIAADTIERKGFPGDRLDLHHAVDALWNMDPPFPN
jgi:hypothetical protein